jgi:large subunit ribosomal protein L35
MPGLQKQFLTTRNAKDSFTNLPWQTDVAMGKAMPKLKTNRGAAKRFQVTGTGKFRRLKANKNHILTKKAPKRKRKLRKDGLVHPTNMVGLRRLLPYA